MPGDLNLKKSWHPALMVNQERVWRQEKKALEERRKIEELRREREEERQLMELQRMNEAKGGKIRQERLDWMYAAPANGSGPNQNELEDYLLGKKRVDKLLNREETAKLSTSCDKKFDISANANTARDVAAKVREDPMLFVKQQEAAAYQALLHDPARLRRLKAQADLDGNADSIQPKRKRKEDRRRKRDARTFDRAKEVADSSREGIFHSPRLSPRSWASTSESHCRDHSSGRTIAKLTHRQEPGRCEDEEAHFDLHQSRRQDLDKRNDGRRKRDNARHEGNDACIRSGDFASRRTSQCPRGPNYAQRDSRSSASHLTNFGPVTTHFDDQRKRRRFEDAPAEAARHEDSVKRSTRHDGTFAAHAAPVGGPHWNHQDSQDSKQRIDVQREAQLAAMASGAAQLEQARSRQISQLREEEEAEVAREEKLRAELLKRRRRGGEGRTGFLIAQEKRLFVGADMSLADRLKRSQSNLQRLSRD